MNTILSIPRGKDGFFMSKQDPLFKFYRGDDFAFNINVKDALDQIVDITGWDVTFTMKRNPNRSDATANLQIVQSNLSGANATNGNVQIILPHLQTKDLNPGKYYFDMEVRTGGYVSTILAGMLEVLPDVTWGA